MLSRPWLAVLGYEVKTWGECGETKWSEIPVDPRGPDIGIRDMRGVLVPLTISHSRYFNVQFGVAEVGGTSEYRDSSDRCRFEIEITAHGVAPNQCCRSNADQHLRTK